ncbi:MAG: class I SAM-dependent methyltransferase [Saprospiraceae bacterium]|nr:class I SAM-dependent methyltransferase [Saprospiraceae bacterium]
MNRIKNSFSGFLRKVRLLYVADYLRYFFVKYQNKKDNEAFKENFPGIVLPPDYLMYESFKLDYASYYFGGKKTAEWVQNITKEWLPEGNWVVLDWGCGPGRVIRHWPENNFTCFGSDVNDKSLAWCKHNFPSIRFLHQQVLPPLDIAGETFDLIYGISILTHLSLSAHFLWIKELDRILKPGGLLFLTTQGTAFKDKLTESEKRDFDQGNLIVRGAVKEGHRTFSSFHPIFFMEKLFHPFVILKHISTENEGNVQDVWIVRKFSH